MGAVAAAEQAGEELSRLRENAARLIGADPANMGLSNTTFHTWLSIVMHLDISGKRLLVAPHEWGQNIGALNALAESSGATIEVLPELYFHAPDLESWKLNSTRTSPQFSFRW